MVYLGSDGWVVHLSPHCPVGSGNSFNPLGATAAACFGAANAFRKVFASQLPVGELDQPFTLSLLDYNPCTEAPLNPPLQTVDLGETHLMGVGAIGSAAIWTLAKIPYLKGILHLIDPEVVDLSNLQRYVLTMQADVGREKVKLAANALGHTRLDSRPHQQRWEEYLGGRKDWSLQRVAVSVDSAIDRYAVQASLPRWVTNAWTQTGVYCAPNLGQ